MCECVERMFYVCMCVYGCACVMCACVICACVYTCVLCVYMRYVCMHVLLHMKHMHHTEGMHVYESKRVQAQNAHNEQQKERRLERGVSEGI